MSRLAFVLAEPASCERRLLGVTLVERLLRALQRAGVGRAVLLAREPLALPDSLREPHWARPGLETVVWPQASGAASLADVRAAWRETAESEPDALVVSGAYVVDPRLLATLCATEPPAVLVDSDPPAPLAALIAAAPVVPGGRWGGAARLGREWLDGYDGTLEAALASAALGRVVDGAREPAYSQHLRREVRPFAFPAPAPEQVPPAEELLLASVQNGTLDLPGYVHAPIETAIVRRLSRHPVTPNQVTLACAILSAVTAAAFATGRLVPGIVLALAVGILDGVDGKLARAKLETTAIGAREHLVDYALELAWWTALAWHFRGAGLVAAFPLLALLVGADLADRVAKASVRDRTGRLLDDLAPFDRAVRFLGGRRNVYVWMLATGIALGAPAGAFAGICLWGALTAAVHVVRASLLALAMRRRAPGPAGVAGASD